MSALERHYTIPELVPLWHLSKATLNKLFRDEPGVLRLAHAENVRAHRRSYLSMRIPESVVQRVHARLRKV